MGSFTVSREELRAVGVRNWLLMSMPSFHGDAAESHKACHPVPWMGGASTGRNAKAKPGGEEGGAAGSVARGGGSGGTAAGRKPQGTGHAQLKRSSMMVIFAVRILQLIRRPLLATLAPVEGGKPLETLSKVFRLLLPPMRISQTGYLPPDRTCWNSHVLNPQQLRGNGFFHDRILQQAMTDLLTQERTDVLDSKYDWALTLSPHDEDEMSDDLAPNYYDVLEQATGRRTGKRQPSAEAVGAPDAHRRRPDVEREHEHKDDGDDSSEEGHDE